MLHAIKRSLKWKFITITTTIVVGIVVSIGFFSYYETSQTIRADVERFSQQVLRQANLNMNRYLNEYEQGFLLIGNMDEYKEWLGYPPDDTYDIVRTYYAIRRLQMQPFVSRHPEILSITMLSASGVETNYTTIYGIRYEYSLKNEPWLSRIDNTDKVFFDIATANQYLNMDGTPASFPVMTLTKLYTPYNLPNGYLKMDVSLAPLQSILQEIHLGERQIGMISDASGTILVHPDTNRILTKLDADIVEKMGGRTEGSFFRKETKELVIFETIPRTDWRILEVVPYADVAGSIGKVRNVTVLIAAIGLVIAIALVVYVTTSITRRITHLRRVIKQTQLGRFDQLVEVGGTDEVTDLAQAYNRMLGQLDQSVHQLTESRLVQQKAILSALQSQIQSHFLYNTLETINSMADLAGHREIEQITISLSRMLRYSSNYRTELVTIDQELRHLDDYLRIISIRYGNVVTYDFAMEAGCGESDCLKAIMQPIVENCIKHGVEVTGEPLHVEVRVALIEPGWLGVTIRDNGAGFGEDELRELQRKLRETETHKQYSELAQVGLLNVHYRLRMYYQDEHSGIQVMNDPQGGAIVRIVFPPRLHRITTESGSGAEALPMRRTP
ncbi:cache domain-containing sensor histidine kinase [Paenibacillus cymbidii]|uniref:cache domain-containing sensor histidine kinase n=1 Tax=Paenibacillus cymbidii TaxID=1639034 RepID=UPI0010815620|nr:sensor histidine kinase [Paenibacillus cymbidii]